MANEIAEAVVLWTDHSPLELGGVGLHATIGPNIFTNVLYAGDIGDNELAPPEKAQCYSNQFVVNPSCKDLCPFAQAVLKRLVNQRIEFICLQKFGPNNSTVDLEHINVLRRLIPDAHY